MKRTHTLLLLVLALLIVLACSLPGGDQARYEDCKNNAEANGWLWTYNVSRHSCYVYSPGDGLWHDVGGGAPLTAEELFAGE